MKLIKSILFLTIIIHTTSFGQGLRKDSIINKNQFCLEIGGAGLFGSFNYERLILEKLNNKLLLRIGISYVPLKVNKNYAIGTPLIPIGLYYLIGVKHNFELGLNNTIGYTIDNISNNSEWNNIIMPSIGYRYETFYNKSIFISVAYSPGLYFMNSKIEFMNWAKIGIGYCF